VSARDQEVLDHVLRDLIADTTSRSPVARRGVPPKELLVSSTSANWPITIEQVLQQVTAEAWAALPAEARPELHAAAADLVANSTPGFVGFECTDRRIMPFRAGDAGDTSGRTSSDRPIHAWPPGFSAEGTLAVVRLSIPRGRHSVTATYVLSRRSQRWAILVREYADRL